MTERGALLRMARQATGWSEPEAIAALGSPDVTQGWIGATDWRERLPLGFAAVWPVLSFEVKLALFLAADAATAVPARA